MAGRAKQPTTDARAMSLAASEHVSAIWDEFRKGRTVYCPRGRDRDPLALAVDASASAYRFVCVRCGAASPWFEHGPAGFQLRAGSVPLIPGSPIIDE